MNKQNILIAVGVCGALLGAGYMFYGSGASVDKPAPLPVPQTSVTTDVPDVGVTNQIPAPADNPTTENQSGSMMPSLPVEPAAAAARAHLATKLGVSENSIVIMLIEEQTWNDGCLGLGGAGEMCTMALVPGFRVELQAGGKGYVYRTNKTGSKVAYDSTATANEQTPPGSIIHGAE